MDSTVFGYVCDHAGYMRPVEVTFSDFTVIFKIDQTYYFCPCLKGLFSGNNRFLGAWDCLIQFA